MVTLRVRVWIETRMLVAVMCACDVTLRVRVWIETALCGSLHSHP